MKCSYRYLNTTGLPHTQGTQEIQGNSGNFQVEEKFRETPGDSRNFDLFFKLRETQGSLTFSKKFREVLRF